MQWLRRSFVTGFFVTVPLFISVAALVWIFNVVDGADDAVLRPAARPPDSGPGHGVDGARRSCWSACSRPTSSAGACCSAARASCCGCRCSGRSTRRSSSWSRRFRRTTSRVQAGGDDRGSAARLRARVPDAGVHRRSRPRPGGAAGGLRADEPPLSRRHRDLSSASGRCFRTSPVEEGIRIFLTGGMALPPQVRV